MAEFTIGAPIAYFTGLLALHGRCDNLYTQPCPCDSVVPCSSEVDQCVHFGMGVKPKNVTSFLMAVTLFVAGCITQYPVTNKTMHRQYDSPTEIRQAFHFDQENIRWLP